MKKQHKIITASVDVETSMAPRHMPWVEGAYLSKVGITVEGAGHRSWTFTHDEGDGRPPALLVKEINEYLKPVGRLVGHNLKFDLIWLQSVGVDISRIPRLYCTMVGEYLVGGQVQDRSLALDACCEWYGLEHKDDRVKPFWDEGIDTAQIPLGILDEYLEQDCKLPLLLFHKQVKQIQQRGMGALVAVQMELLRDLVAMEANGALVDQEAIQRIAKEYTERVTRIDQELAQYLGPDINLNSGDDLSAALYGGVLKRVGEEWVIREFKYYSKYYPRKCIVDVPVKGIGFQPPKGAELQKEGFYKTDRDTIQNLRARTKAQRAVKRGLLKRSEENKTRTTIMGKDGVSGLIGKIMRDGRIHGQFNQTVTKTGRLSSSGPNLQNFPRAKTAPIKTIFIPSFDWIVNCDLAQLEWRIAAALSGDPTMIKEIREGVDYHADNAIRYFGADPSDPNFQAVRTDAKVLGFRMIYGGSPYAFYKDPRMPHFSLSKWEQIHAAFFAKYWRLREWQEANIATVNAKGYLVNPSGRILRFKQYTLTRRGETYIGYKSQQIVNYPVQSFATADVMPLAMVEIARRRQKEKLRSRLMFQVHDSLVHDSPHNEVVPIAHLAVSVFEALPRLIEKTWGFKVPIPLTGDVEFGKNYGSLMKLPRSKYM